jgi:hypothetical protein
MPHFDGMLGRAKQVARSETLAVVDVPSAVPGVGRPAAVSERFAVLVDADSGRVETLAWPLDPGGGSEWVAAGSGYAEWLVPGAIQDRELIWDGRDFRPGLPERRRPLALPADVRELAGRERLSKDEAKELERGLRGALGAAR